MLHLKPEEQQSFQLTCFTVSKAASQTLAKRIVRDALRRHQRGDWGGVDTQTREYNDANLKLGDGELVSIFEDSVGTRFTVNTSRFHAYARVSLQSELS